ncbi:M1 family metallopeptidase [Robertkochia aurantiaca]|uniref:M1 family metallopeptidase n=1 Tax=Robertkochia aurantiaca TaxID=2873700 RepID=UPI001CCE2E5D|nr:M1 family metallopeptidase [Robertkochia sp. 3YJGBD-33]
MKLPMIKNLFFLLAALPLFAVQPPESTYWQQKVDYTMEVDMNVDDYTYTGVQELKYTNNSPDTLRQVFYHLYFNAFQPGSEMDVRSRTIADPDERVGARIADLKENEIGYLKVKSLKQNGTAIEHETVGTVLEVALDKPILPGETVTFDMEFEGQVPVQIRRSGRNNEEGVALSMTQWYPKLAEYDFEGWHAHPYIGREFQGVWGDFDVKITIDKDYTIGGTGYLQNPDEIGHGYTEKDVKVKGKTLTWHFFAPMVHDFAWGADPDYIHDTLQVENGPMLHFFYKDNDEIKENWKKLQPKAAEMMQFFNRNIGPYPWDQYSIIQGGDGGMEYAMCTLITGERPFGSLAGVTAHEMAHAWFQHLLATNESKHEWMDEGFTSFISSLCMNQVMDRNEANPFESSYRGYVSLANSGMEQPMTTQADRYQFNRAYGISAYSKGSVFLSQLGYIIGQDKLMETIRRYYDEFKFKHPTPNDFKRVAEKVSGMQLDWYLTDWTKTTARIDYAIQQVEDTEEGTQVVMERIGLMPMPIDVMVFFNDGSKAYYYAPLRMQRGEKANPFEGIDRTVLKDWPWAFPTYEFEIDRPLSDIQAIVIDPSGLMADVNRENNIWQAAGE